MAVWATKRNSTCHSRVRERIIGGRFLRRSMEPALELSVKADVEPALTVFEESADALIRVVPPFFGP